MPSSTGLNQNQVNMQQQQPGNPAAQQPQPKPSVPEPKLQANLQEQQQKQPSSTSTRSGELGSPNVTPAAQQPQLQLSVPEANLKEQCQTKTPAYLQHQSPEEDTEEESFKAISYMTRVQQQFGKKSAFYKEFLDIMRKRPQRDILSTIIHLSNLFKDHSKLLVEFNTFLPKGYHIQLQANGQIQVLHPGQADALPSSGSGLAAQTKPDDDSAAGTLQPVSSDTALIHNVLPPQGRQILITPQPVQQAAQPQYQQVAVLNNTANSQPAPPSPAPTHNIPPPHRGQNPVLIIPQRGQQAAQGQYQQTAILNHVTNYVNTVVDRFQNEPGITASFLSIIQMYLTHLTAIRGDQNLNNQVTVFRQQLTYEVHREVSQLFSGHQDLLEELQQFLQYHW